MNKVRESFRELLNKLSPAQLEEIAAIAYEIKKERESSSKVVRFMEKSSRRCYAQGYKLGLMLGNKF